jgi:hypothetical protein
MDRVDAAAESSHEVGEDIGFDEEAELQQEKMSGGAGGTVTSTNIQPMDPGVTGYTDSTNPEGFAATDGQPSAVPHGTTNGTECLSCHKTGEQQIPQSHVDAGITNGQCASCHTGLN